MDYIKRHINSDNCFIDIYNGSKLVRRLQAHTITESDSWTAYGICINSWDVYELFKPTNSMYFEMRIKHVLDKRTVGDFKLKIMRESKTPTYGQGVWAGNEPPETTVIECRLVKH